jgi:hypothetical protein
MKLNGKKYISEESKKQKTYSSTFKKNFVLENYIALTSLEKRRDFTKLRISAHKLHIESGRYYKPKIPRDRSGDVHFVPTQLKMNTTLP